VQECISNHFKKQPLIPTKFAIIHMRILRSGTRRAFKNNMIEDILGKCICTYVNVDGIKKD
jgi:hypothetical protein